MRDDRDLLLLAGSAAGHRAQPGEQLVHAERLGDVVVGAGVEGVDLVEAVGPTGQHEDRDVGPAAQPGDDLGAVHVGQAEVEDDERRAGGRRPCSRASAPSAAMRTS